MPHFSETDPDCKPTGFMATDWLHDELAGFGSYSNFQVGLEEGDTDIRTMREGLPDHGLWLAGEHTAPFVGLGTATGAYWSGESVGRRIAEAYGLTKWQAQQDDSQMANSRCSREHIRPGAGAGAPPPAGALPPQPSFMPMPARVHACRDKV
ncbi:hypothetical protein CEP52_004032 [Fusarium oligoseptatum]|uniref:Amine oxidase domain-containing protein n=1 Tax=Fusarium oligoseptatum TaxID=2604345 RepID=A0A428U5G0_9HYPO|nr:hypothetical protein CEP52_004032 [Fusarium oligoseptatum]